LNGDGNKTREAEKMLLGAAAGENTDDGQTFRIEDNTGLPKPFEVFPPRDKTAIATLEVTKMSTKEYFALPHRPAPKATPSGDRRWPQDTRAPRDGHVSGQERTLLFSVTAQAVKKDLLLLQALRAVVWTTLAFGSLGNRARRGYGGLTLVEAGDVPCMPLFGDEDLSREELETRLTTGLDTAQGMVRKWLESKGKNPLDLTAVRSGFDPTTAQHSFFQIASMAQVRLGNPVVDPDEGNARIVALMRGCHAQSLDSDYGRTLGRANFGENRRLASPLWVRFYRIASGQYVPVLTYSPRVVTTGSAQTMVNAILNSVGASNFC